MNGFEVKRSEKYGLFSVEGKELIPCKYDWLSYQKGNGFIEVEQGDNRGLYSVDGKEIIPCKYGFIWDFQYKESGCFEVEKDEKKGIYDSQGNELLSCIYDRVFIQGNYITFELNGKEGLYNIKEKKEIFKCKYHYLSHPNEGLVVFITEKDGKCGYMDLKGHVVIEPQYDNADSFKEGIAQVTKDGVTSIIKHPLLGTELNIASGSEVWVDVDIPQTSIRNEEAFAFIIANENYAHFSGADYSHNDGKVFAEYCKKTLGMPENNIRYYEDATFGNIAKALTQLKDIADVYDGDAKIIFYFSGLGITDDKTKDRYILPTDASLSALASTGYNVEDLMATLNQLKTQYTFLVIDAPFNGNDKTGKQLATGRGVMISNKRVTPQSNVIGLFGDSCKKTKAESLKLFKDVQSPGIIITNDVITNIKI